MDGQGWSLFEPSLIALREPNGIQIVSNRAPRVHCTLSAIGPS